MQPRRLTIAATNELTLDEHLRYCPAAALVHKKVKNVLTLLCTDEG